MILSTSDIREKLLKTALVYTAAAVFCAFAGAVYEKFGHGVYSYPMIYAFGFPLAGGALPALVSAVLKNPKLPPWQARYFYHSALAVFTVGSVFSGVLEIYGTTSRLSKIYPAAGAVLLLISALSLTSLCKNREV